MAEEAAVSTEELQATSNVVEEQAGQASHIFNSTDLRRTKFINSIENAEEKTARSYQSETPNRIPEVPQMLRNTMDFKTYYEPSAVSIGPYHYKRHPRLQQVEELKPIIAKKFVLSLIDNEDVGKSFSMFEEKLMEMRFPSMNDMYDENVTKHIDQEDFIQMMFLDGCFILYFIFCIQTYSVEWLGMKNHITASVQQDLFLVENQLPFYVLKVLMRLMDDSFEKRLDDSFETFGMIMLANFASNTYGGLRVRNISAIIGANPLHLLDLLHINLLDNVKQSNIPPTQTDVLDKRKSIRQLQNKIHYRRHLFHGVKELSAAGIFFRPYSTGSLRDIKFRSYCIFSRLTLPRITIDRSTRKMFLNLIAHESCMNNPDKFGFTSYLCFLDLLIDRVEDVKELRTAGILQNYLDSDEEVANLFNEIAADLLPEVDTYEGVKFKILRYLGGNQKAKMASWVAEVIHDHFKSPWKMIALLAGIIVISLTFVQTYFTIFPRSSNPSPSIP